MAARVAVPLVTVILMSAGLTAACAWTCRRWR
jgi:hypothetical protein